MLATLELAFLFYRAGTPWGWAIPVPGSSPILTRLTAEPDVGLVRGPWGNDVAVRAGRAVAFPYLGITPPPPSYLLERAMKPGPLFREDPAWARRFGVTHGIWEGDQPTPGAVRVVSGADPVIDRAAWSEAGDPPRRTWRLEPYPGAAPPARVATIVREATDWGDLHSWLEVDRLPDEVWFLKADRPPEDAEPRARSTRLRGWDGHSGVVEYDEACDLVIRWAYYPGWVARLDDGPELPVARADGGLQAVRLPGVGPTRVEVRYRPTGLVRTAALSLVATGAALAVLVASLGRSAAVRLAKRPGP